MVRSDKASPRFSRRAPRLTEREIQKQIIDWLQFKRLEHWRQEGSGKVMQAGGNAFMIPSASRGCPDIVGCLPDGRMFMVEVKKPGWNPPSEEALENAHIRFCKEGKKDPYETFRYQRKFQHRFAKSGALVIVARSLECVSNPIEEYLRQITYFDAAYLGIECDSDV